MIAHPPHSDKPDDLSSFNVSSRKNIPYQSNPKKGLLDIDQSLLVEGMKKHLMDAAQWYLRHYTTAEPLLRRYLWRRGRRYWPRLVRDVSARCSPDQKVIGSNLYHAEQEMPEQEVPRQDVPEQEVPEQEVPEQEVPEQEIKPVPTEQKIRAFDVGADDPSIQEGDSKHGASGDVDDNSPSHARVAIIPCDENTERYPPHNYHDSAYLVRSQKLYHAVVETSVDSVVNVFVDFLSTKVYFIERARRLLYRGYGAFHIRADLSQRGCFKEVVNQIIVMVADDVIDRYPHLIDCGVGAEYHCDPTIDTAQVFIDHVALQEYLRTHSTIDLFDNKVIKRLERRGISSRVIRDHPNRYDTSSS